MYIQLVGSFIAALILIFIARKYPITSSFIYIVSLVYFVGFSRGRTELGGISIRFPLPFWRAIKSCHYGLNTNRSVLNLILFMPFGYLLPYLWGVISITHFRKAEWGD